MREEWRKVLGNDDYSVSNLGRIRRDTATRSTWAGRILNGRQHNHGYRSVSFAVQTNIYANHLVHRVVFEAFNGKIAPGLQINHLNGIKTDNRLVNLECVTSQQNNKHAIEFGLSDNKGERHGNSKLTDSNVREIRKLAGCGISQSEIATRFGIGRRTVRKIKTKQAWSHI